MKLSGRPWTLSSINLALAGTTLIAAGLYFMVLRPPLLPEDVRYMGLSAAELDVAHGCELACGFIFGLGLLVSGKRRKRQP